MTNTTTESRDLDRAQVASEPIGLVWAEYAEQGLQVFPIKRGDKNPGDMGIYWKRDWNALGRRTFPEMAATYSTCTFRGHGLWLSTGQVSKRVVLDLDKPGAETHWRELLGEVVFNRALKVTSGKGKHLHFRIREDDERAWPSHSDNEIGYDFRADGTGIVMPPSFHKSGRRYEWAGGELMDAPECLRKENQPKADKVHGGSNGRGRGRAAQDLMLDFATGERGNNWLTRVSGTMALSFHSYEVYEAVLTNINQASAYPIDHDSFKKTIDSVWNSEQEKNQMPNPDSPVPVARRLNEDLWTFDGQLTLRRWRGSWVKWTGSHWDHVEDQSVTADIQNRLEHAVYDKAENGEVKTLSWEPNTARVRDVANAVRNINLLPKEVDTGDWLDHRGCGQVVAFQNGLLDIKTRTMSPATPAFFSMTSLPFEYEETDEQPGEWLKFLDSVLPDDADAIKVIQEWFGYILSGRNDLEKLLLLVGQTRSGKGTIQKVLSALLGGRQNIAGMTMSAFTTNFGLAPMVGKTLAVVGDARTPKRDRETIVERFLAITGRDPIQIDRKNREAFDGVLNTRIMLMSNETLSLPDPSGALPNRFITVEFKQSFLGREDLGLLDRLFKEVPAILRWSLDGIDRLAEQGRFTEPDSSKSVRAEMNANSSKVKEFAEDRMEFGPDKNIPVLDLFDEYTAWCKLRGLNGGSSDTFGTQLSAAFRGKFKKTRPTINGLRIQVYTGMTLRKTAD
ncbi:phage/plasmid primase, P4 family [Streptomyces sp. NPDC001868]|uniref:phage/plasmid primase, P4 family n=1 Tax=Streptomyces sp. NPDC001868 TaxID=3154401 RepID=UPI00331F857B